MTLVKYVHPNFFKHDKLSAWSNEIAACLLFTQHDSAVLNKCWKSYYAQPCRWICIQIWRMTSCTAISRTILVTSYHTFTLTVRLAKFYSEAIKGSFAVIFMPWRLSCGSVLGITTASNAMCVTVSTYTLKCNYQEL